MTTLQAVTHAMQRANLAILQRNAAIRAAHAEGHTLREIAKAAAMSVEGVRKIINRPS